MGEKDGKTKQKIQTRCVVFFFMDFSGCGGFQRRFLLGGGEDLTEEKWGVFGVAASTNFSIPWRAGIGLIRFLCQTIILGPIYNLASNPPTQDAIVTTIGGMAQLNLHLTFHLGGSG